MSKTRISKSWRKKSAFSTWSGQLVCYALIKDGRNNHESAYHRYIQQGTYHPTEHNLAPTEVDFLKETKRNLQPINFQFAVC